MTKFIFLNGWDTYEQYIVDTVKGYPDVVVREQFTNKFFHKLFELHNAWPINKRVELPLKNIWFRYCLDETKIDDNEDIICLIYESSHLSHSKKFIIHLRDKYKKIKCYFCLLNPINEYNLEIIKSMGTLYDATITFYRKDSDKYGLLYTSRVPYILPVLKKEPIEYDLFFIGSDKGRLDILHKIYKVLTHKGLKCKFFIVGVSKEQELYPKEIVYNKRIQYEQVLDYVNKSRCVLEVLKDGASYSSIRAIEAMQYKKKLLTTNHSIINEPFYNDRIIQVFSNDKQIDVEFFRNSSHPDDYPDSDYWSFAPFKEFLLNI